MSDTINIKKYRSEFWCSLIPSKDRVEVVVSKKYTKIIDIILNKYNICKLSQWNLTSNSNSNYKISIQKSDLIYDYCDEPNKFIWLGLNFNTKDHFNIDLLDYCITYDWNFLFENAKRTAIGEAEYKIKYDKCNDEEKRKYIQVLKNALEECYQYIPIDNKENLIITTIPISQNEKKESKLSWKITKYISDNVANAQLLELSISIDKQKVKSLTVLEKINMWEGLYVNNIKLPYCINGKEIIIVDDLYQSGISMWMSAKFLKDNGASKVSGLVALKAQRDSDNK